jgi:hypothetical protein
MKRVINSRLSLVLMALCIITGIFIGLNMRNVEYRETVRYVRGEPIVERIEVPVPYRVEVPRYYRLPTITETVVVNDTLAVVERVDTARIIAEFIAINHYQFNVFDIDTVGVFDVNLSVQYNLLRSFEYEFVPMVREVTRTVQPTLIPFASISANTFSTVGVGGGVLFRNFGVEYQFLRNHSLNSSGHQVGVKWRW